MDIINKETVPAAEAPKVMKITTRSETIMAFPPGEFDVLLGRGKGAIQFQGNQRFESMIDENFDKYFATTTSSEKKIIAKYIVDRVNEKGRFVQFDLTKGGWVPVGAKTAYNKVYQAFQYRQRRHGRRNSIPSIPRKLAKSYYAHLVLPPSGHTTIHKTPRSSWAGEDLRQATSSIPKIPVRSWTGEGGQLSTGGASNREDSELTAAEVLSDLSRKPPVWGNPMRPEESVKFQEKTKRPAQKKSPPAVPGSRSPKSVHEAVWSAFFSLMPEEDRPAGVFK